MGQVERALGPYRVHLEAINAALYEVLSSRVALVQKIGGHSVLAHGKRIRPLLFVLCCDLCGYHGKDLYRLSTIFEYVHAASLLHDDVLDNAETRRKRPSANKVWGNHAAVLEGDYLYAKACALAVTSNSLRFLEKITDTTITMTEGQILELSHTWDWDISEATCMEIIAAKTASLISASCACAAIVAGLPPAHEAALADFGMAAGVAFQLIDDLLDYEASESVLGKPAGKDIREGKVTLPLLYALRGFDKDGKDALLLPFRRATATEADVDRVVTVVKGSDGLPEVRRTAADYAQKATSSLSLFPPSKTREELLEMTQLILSREY